jgi:DNA-directed RNA polymerase specialized sigma24 family protein
MPAPELQEFLAKIQGGDGGAVEAMLQELDPFLRGVIRLRLLDGRLRRAVDTTDILQSLLKDFLRQPAAGERAETSSAQLCAYLAAAVRHKVQTRLRKERRHAGSLPEEWEPASPEPGVGKLKADSRYLAAVPQRIKAPRPFASARERGSISFGNVQRSNEWVSTVTGARQGQSN